MLNILHNKINNIVPILSVEKISDTNFIVQYTEPNSVTNEQLILVNNIINSWPLDEAKLNKLQLLDNKWNNQLGEGFLTPYGWRLGLQNSDVTLLTGAFLLAKEAANMNLSQDATIVDLSGISHTLSIYNFTVLMLEYGQYRSELSSNYAATKKAIEEAQSFEELNNIPV
jgi:hypothetical protein